MVMWPVMWQQQALAALGIEDSDATYAIMTAWQQSTPLPPYSYNPIGMPAGSSGSKPFLGTPYAGFPSIGLFYAALRAFGETHQGGQLAMNMLAQFPYSATWRFISSLGWPGSKTETDYPSALLDLTTASYRASVKAAPRPMRKTSGLITSPDSTTTSSLSRQPAINKASQSLTDAGTRLSSLIRRQGNG